MSADSRHHARSSGGGTAFAIEGVSIDEHVIRYGSILRSAQVGERVAQLLADPRYMHGVAYGFRSDTDILPLDI